MPRSKEDLQRMGTPAPALAAAIKATPMPDFSNGDPSATMQTIRHNRSAYLTKLRRLYPIPGPIPEQVKEILHRVPARDGHQIPVKIYTPVDANPASPLIVMVHEGGWAFGDVSDEDLNCRLFTRDLGAVCVNVEYRLAPEHKFPTQLYDCQDVLRWAASTAEPSNHLLPADPRRGFVVGGGSAGGNLAAALSQMSLDERLDPPLTGQYLCVPSLIWQEVLPARWSDEFHSHDTAVHDPVLQLPTSEEPNMFIRAAEADTADVRFSPLLRPDCRGLPAAYFQVTGLDPLRDDGLIYERLLREESGVATRIDVYEGYGHMFWTNWPELEQSKEFVRDTLSGMRWLLDTGRTARSRL